MTFQKLRPIVITYRDYKYFNNVMYRNDILKGISNCYLEFNESGFSRAFLFMLINVSSTRTLKADICKRQSCTIYK